VIEVEEGRVLVIRVPLDGQSLGELREAFVRQLAGCDLKFSMGLALIVEGIDSLDRARHDPPLGAPVPEVEEW